MTKEEIKQYFGADTHEEGEAQSIQIFTCGRRTQDYRSFQTVQPFFFWFFDPSYRNETKTHRRQEKRC